jgi:Flp pilus assembly secretin CpaC
MKISSLAGSSINAVPVLANRSYSGVATLRANEAIVIASEVDKSETRAISGIPGLSEIPGMNNITEKDIQKSYASLLIILTPHVLLSPHGLGHSPMMRVDRSTQAR